MTIKVISFLKAFNQAFQKEYSSWPIMCPLYVQYYSKYYKPFLPWKLYKMNGEKNEWKWEMLELTEVRNLAPNS